MKAHDEACGSSPEVRERASKQARGIHTQTHTKMLGIAKLELVRVKTLGTAKWSLVCLLSLSLTLTHTYSTLCIRCRMRNTGYLCFCITQKKRISSRIIVVATYLFISGIFGVARWLRLLWTPFFLLFFVYDLTRKKGGKCLNSTRHSCSVYVLRGPFDFVSHRHSHHHCLHVELCHHSRHVAQPEKKIK